MTILAKNDLQGTNKAILAVLYITTLAKHKNLLYGEILANKSMSVLH